MKHIFLLPIIAISLFANSAINTQFFSTAKPFETYTVKSSVSGKVDYVNSSLEGKSTNNNKIIQIDNKVDKVELAQLKQKYTLMQSIIKVEEKNYQRLLKISSKSQYERDNQKIKVLNLKLSLADLETAIAKLQNNIDNKTLIENNRYIYDINIKKDDYVNPGTILYTAHDLSKAKLEIFIPINEVSQLKSKVIYLNDKKTDYKLDKIYKVADSKHISTYKCEIIIDKPKNFSKLIKVEFK